MDEDTATRFVSSLVKSIQALCNGYINFTSSIEVIGHIHLNIDRNVKFNYVLTEEVSKSVSEGATLFASHSYHSHPPPSVATKQSSDTPRPNRRKSHQVPRIDDSDPLNIVTLLPVPDVSSVEPDNSFNSTHVGDSSDSSHSGKLSVPQDSSRLLNVKPEKWQPATTCTQDSLDRRRKNTSSHKMLSPAAKRSRNNDANSTPAIQNPDFGVIEIKEEPEEPSVCLGDSSSMAVGQDIQTPDFSNVVMESLDRVGQIEGSQLVAGGDSMQQQQQQPFPVMLHANPSIPTSAIPVSAVPIPGPSTDVQATPSTSGESKAGIMKKKKAGAKAGYKTYRTKSAAKKTKAVATAAKKSVAKAAKTTAEATKSGTMKISMRSFATSVFAQNTLPKYKSCYREYTEEDINEAIELVHGGMPVIDAALKYGIPRATLFNRSRDGCKTHSGRCSEVFARTHTGGSSCKKPRSKPMQYTLESVEKAIEAVHAGMPVIDASILYQIPRATLFVRSSRGCPSHAGRCSTVFSNGKIRRTKAPKHKYLTLMQKRSMQSQAASSTQTSREVLVTPIASIRGVPIVDATTGQVMQFKREPSVENALMGVESGHATFELENVDLAQPSQVFSPPEMSDSTSVSGTPLPSSIVVKIERASDDEN